jgi:hypothetical protein
MPAIAEPKFSPDTKSVPTQAMQFDCGNLQFAATQEGDVTIAPISMLGRSAEPINHWYWGAIVHDMAGFSTDHDRVPIDWCHDDETVLGYLDKYKADNKGLNVSGKLISFSADDRAAQLMKESAAGIPYQASIFFRADRLEYVPEGFSTSVNGYQLSGPAIIVREWGLRGMAVCLYGADHRTQSKFSDGDQIPVSIFSLESSMPKAASKPVATDKTTPDQLSENPTAQTQLSENPTAPVETPTASTQLTETKPSDSRAELKQFITAFGAENGASWYSEGLAFADAQTKFVGTLQSQLAAKDKEIEELKTKLSSIDRGSDKPLSFSSPDAPQSQQPSEFAHLGDNMSKFASGLKLPVPSKN